jgi:hypothetical protein
VRRDRLAHRGQLDEHHVSQLALRVIGDPDGGDARALVERDPFMIFAVA